jgi:hypothetical protein
MKPIRGLLLAAVVLMGIVATGCEGADAAATDQAAAQEETVTEKSALCTADNITGPYNMDWDSPDGTSHSTSMNAVSIQLHETCPSWTAKGYLTGSMRWFQDGAPVYSFVGATFWNYGTATWSIHELSQDNVFRFSCNYVRPLLWHCKMDRLLSNGTYVSNGTIDLWH